MHKVLPMIVLSALAVMTCRVMAETPPGFEPSVWAGDEAPQKDAATLDEAGCGWQPGFFLNDLDDIVQAFSVYDDGTGEALYAGGDFITAGGVTVNYIAKWNGTAWSALSGPSGTGVNNRVFALAVYDDGTGEALYAGGEFTTAGGVTANYISKWDGTEWSVLSGPSGAGTGGGTYAVVSALAVYDDGTGKALYAGGRFATAGGVTVNGIAKWNGTAWSALSGPSGTGMSGGGQNQSVDSLAVYDDGTGPALYAGGNFRAVGGVTVNYIARWDGMAWSDLRSQGWPWDAGTDSYVYALAVYDDGTGKALYAGGRIGIAGGIAMHGIAKWDGTRWSALSGPTDTGMNQQVRALAVYDDGTGEALYAGGIFTTAGGITVNYIAKWDGTEWSALGGSSGDGMNSWVLAVAVYDDGTGEALYAGGSFSTAGGGAANRIAKWDGTAWSAPSRPMGSGVNNPVLALAANDDGSGTALYAGGYFTTAGGIAPNGIARWDGIVWSTLSGPLGTGVSSGVTALTVHDDGSGTALYAGGDFRTAGGVTVNGIAKWDGTLWSALSWPLGVGVGGTVKALAVYDDGLGEALYVGGGFNFAGGVYVKSIAKWVDGRWSVLDGPWDFGMDDDVNALAVYDDGTGGMLYAGGEFITAGGQRNVNHIAKWNGTKWSGFYGPSAAGMNNPVLALAVYDDGTGEALYAGGEFTTAGGVVVNHIAKWDGTAWSALGGPSGAGMNDWVEALAVYDDGTGEALYAGGGFYSAGGVRANGIAKWDGSEWSALFRPAGTGVDGSDLPVVYALAVYDDGTGEALYAGGRFGTAGGVASNHIAKWVGDNEAPIDPTTLISTTHATGAWSATNNVGIEWSGAADICESGLAGYSVLFDTSAATTPNTIVDVAYTSDPHSTISEVLVDGPDHWFHLRTCDGAGNCSDGVHLGPFRIDTTYPGVVSGLTSTSHTVGELSFDMTIDVEWTAAVDTLSGVEGYAVEYSNSANWTCDQVQDVGGTTATSGRLSDGNWFVHVCAVDAAGNWGDVVSMGPLVIGRILPEVRSVEMVN